MKKNSKTGKSNMEKSTMSLPLRFTAAACICLLAASSSSAGEKDLSREQVLKMYEKAAAFMIKIQNKDGSWGERGKGLKGELGSTGLAVMGLAQAPVELRSKYKSHCTKAIEWMLKHQQSDGSFIHKRSGYMTYRTSLALMAMKRTDAKKYKSQIAKAAGWLSETQFSDKSGVKEGNPNYGGWGYDKKGVKPDADLSNASMALQALKESGLSPDDPVFKRAARFISGCQNNSETNKGVGKIKAKDDGGFFYDPGLSRNKSSSTNNKDGTVSYESYSGMTYAGLMSLLYCKVDKRDPRVKAAMKWICAHWTLDKNSGLGIRNSKKDADQQGLFYYYLAFAKALDAYGQTVIKTKAGDKNWPQELARVLVKKQSPAGFWKNEASARWWEGNPLIPTVYSLNALNRALKHIPAAKK
jgi:squalene-hopene/tetraprenyl-beta-curcumene cyclase